MADGTWLRTLDGSSGAWGRGGTPLGGNSFKQPLPEVLHLTFFDSIDNQFYQLIQPLPKDKIQRLFTTVHKGMGDEEEDSPPKVYDTFDIGFCPERLDYFYLLWVQGFEKKLVHGKPRK